VSSPTVNWPFCHTCLNHYEGFCRCQSTVILAALLENEVRVPMGRAGQAELDSMRKRLLAAALAKWPNTAAVPMEILTLASAKGALGEIDLVVRRYR